MEKDLVYLLNIQTDKRLLRLFAVGCCYQIWEKLIDEKSRTAVEVAERFADGQVTKKELNKAYDASWAANNSAANSAVCDVANCAAFYAAFYASNEFARDATYNTAYFANRNAAIEKQLELYHCIFTKIVFTTTNQNAINLAKIIYKERQWSLIPILGDALEEGGCIAEVISHCKEEKHARGCWVVDNILGKR